MIIWVNFLDHIEASLITTGSSMTRKINYYKNYLIILFIFILFILIGGRGGSHQRIKIDILDYFDVFKNKIIWFHRESFIFLISTLYILTIWTFTLIYSCDEALYSCLSQDCMYWDVNYWIHYGSLKYNNHLPLHGKFFSIALMLFQHFQHLKSTCLYLRWCPVGRVFVTRV